MVEQIILATYFIILIIICIKIVADSTTPSKALAYLLLVILLPAAGIVFYLSVGLNYRKRKLYEKKIYIDEVAYPELQERIRLYSEELLNQLETRLGAFFPMAKFMASQNFLTVQNRVTLLINGEEKFPKVLDAIKQAKTSIHLEYYIFENDAIGNKICDLLLEKHEKGVKIRFIYDDFGSRGIKRRLVKKLVRAGIEVVPFYKIAWMKMANRMNYRNHRKIIVIDGSIGFVGGINVSDKYLNPTPKGLYWRDTHLEIIGSAVLNLQYMFLCDWNFCTGQNVGFSDSLFPIVNKTEIIESTPVQIMGSGPDYDYSSIMYSMIQLIMLARVELCITTPYFIPPKTLLDAITIAALSGVRVRLLVPDKSDSYIVNLTSESYFEKILAAGVEVYRYTKGFVHAKTIVCDGKVAMVGTANLDNRSFDLNFEVNAVVYDDHTATELRQQFEEDLQSAKRINYDVWQKRPRSKRFLEKIVNLVSPLM